MLLAVGHHVTLTSSCALRTRRLEVEVGASLQGSALGPRGWHLRLQSRVRGSKARAQVLVIAASTSTLHSGSCGRGRAHACCEASVPRRALRARGTAVASAVQPRLGVCLDVCSGKAQGSETVVFASGSAAMGAGMHLCWMQKWVAETASRRLR